jgi:hypothetical protein
MNTKVFKLVFVLLTVSFLIEQSAAIPAFARKYDMSCNTCHRPIPKLKAYGEEFAGNAFQLPDKEPPRFVRETGDEWLYLMRELPFALRLEGYVRWQPQTAHRLDFQAPYLVKLLSGGQIAKDIAYYFYFFFGERGEVAGLEDAFIMFNNVFNEDLDIYVGQFQVSDPLFKRELRLTLEDYQIYRTKVGSASPNLTYDRGIMFTYSLPSKTDITLEILNGTGLGAMDATRSFDTDAYKNLFVRVSQDAGENLRIGGLGYFGKEEKFNEVNSLWMVGTDVTLSVEPLELNVQYVEREDKNPIFFAPIAQKVKTRGAFAELIYTPNGDESKWYGALLYNWVESNLGTYKYNTLTGHTSYLVARNLRLIGEYTYDFEQKANKLSVGFVSAF